MVRSAANLIIIRNLFRRLIEDIREGHGIGEDAKTRAQNGQNNLFD